jgi:hypothetical protein
MAGVGMTDRLYAFCDNIERIVTEEDYDWIHVIEGPEGCGKSSMAWAVAKHIHPDRKVNYVFTFDQFKETVAPGNTAPGDVILIDEGTYIFYSRDSMSKPNKEAIKMMTAIRSKNLIILICIPNYLIIDKYLRFHRVKTLAHVVKRGWFHHFGPRKTQLLKPTKHNPLKLKYPDYDFRDFYPDAAKMWPEEWAEYKKKKEESTVKTGKPKEETTGRMFKCRKRGHLWLYRGKKERGATCPMCRSSGYSIDE